ncbi:MAG: hypothetical protein JSV91_07405 [Phycisphaerales bacterium]|nr:MAG: hypothetical protein JSV91_07405 [Phycisphaerales bacterium]
MGVFRSFARSQIAFPVALAVTLVLALLPTSWLGWTSAPAELLGFIVQPLSAIGDTAGTWIRRGTLSRTVPEETPEASRWREEAQRFQQLYRAEQLRVQELEEQLEQLQLIPIEQLNVQVNRFHARVVASHPTSPGGTVTLRGGERVGVTPGAIAVYGGVHLLGRVIEVSAFSCRLRPITSRATRAIRAVVLPADQPGGSMSDAPAISLQPRGDGAFIADAETIWALAEGDIVCLADPAWPQSAQGMLIGLVESLKVKDSEPLRNEIVIRPRHLLSNLNSVVLIVEQESDTGRVASGSDPEGGGS